jgi:hypothetical protein
MAEYVWWFLIVGLVVGGALVAAISLDTSRREEDIIGQEREAEATLLAVQLSAEGQAVDRSTVAAVLRAHRDYRRLPPPDGFEPIDAIGNGRGFEDSGGIEAGSGAEALDPDSLAALVRAGRRSASDRDPDRDPDEVRDGRGGGADQDLPPA